LKCRRFYTEYGSPGLINLLSVEHQYKCLAQKFVESFSEIKRVYKDVTDDEAFKKAEEELIAKGNYFKKNQEGPKSEKRIWRASPKNELLKGIDLSKIMTK